MRELTKKEMFNAKANAIALKDCNEQIDAVAVSISTNKDGEAVGYIYTTDKMYYTTTSATALDLLIEILDFDDDVVNFNVIRRRSKNDREYLVLELI